MLPLDYMEVAIGSLFLYTGSTKFSSTIAFLLKAGLNPPLLGEADTTLGLRVDDWAPLAVEAPPKLTILLGVAPFSLLILAGVLDVIGLAGILVEADLPSLVFWILVNSFCSFSSYWSWIF